MLAEVEPRRERVLGHLDDLPAGLGGHRAVDGETVVVGVEGEAVEVDDHAGGFVPALAETVGPGREQGQAGDGARPVAVESTREREELRTAMAERCAEHAELGEEGGGQGTGGHGHSCGEIGHRGMTVRHRAPPCRPVDAGHAPFTSPSPTSGSHPTRVATGPTKWPTVTGVRRGVDEMAPRTRQGASEPVETGRPTGVLAGGGSRVVGPGLPLADGVVGRGPGQGARRLDVGGVHPRAARPDHRANGSGLSKRSQTMANERAAPRRRLRGLRDHG